MFDLLMLMAHKQRHVTVMFTKCHYTSDIAVFDSSQFPNTTFFKTTTPLIEAILSMKRCDIFPLGDYRPLQ